MRLLCKHRAVLAGGDGTVYTWDMRTQRCRDRKVDEGTLNGTSLACADGFFATGSDSGAVNLHLRGQGGSPTASSAAIVARYQPTAAVMSKPAKTFLHLTTTVDSLAFSPDSQVRCGPWVGVGVWVVM